MTNVFCICKPSVSLHCPTSETETPFKQGLCLVRAKFPGWNVSDQSESESMLLGGCSPVSVIAEVAHTVSAPTASTRKNQSLSPESSSINPKTICITSCHPRDRYKEASGGNCRLLLQMGMVIFSWVI